MGADNDTEINIIYTDPDNVREKGEYKITLTMREKASVSELPEEETLSGLTRQSSTHSLADNA